MPPRFTNPLKSVLSLRVVFLLLALAMATGCSPKKPDDGRVILHYWDKWTGFEEDAMRAVVNDFNASQDRITVKYLAVGEIDRKLMLATAGGNPPDVAGMWSWNLPTFAENNAIQPLDKYAKEAGIGPEKYLEIYWRIVTHRGHLWALPTTPATVALHWNKKLFREVGLDPEQPPRSLKELEEFNELLSKRRPDGSMDRIGHLPTEPGWWQALWGLWFGGRLWDGADALTLDTPEQLEAMRWIATYPERFGVSNLQKFRDGFGNFASPQNPFFTERVAMVVQGPWLYNFIKTYGPADFEWGVAPFPSVDPGRFPDVTISDCDVLVIPTASPHPDEAFEFMEYVNRQGPMEKLCKAQQKFSPLREVSSDFYRTHPNPYIHVFRTLAEKATGYPVHPPAWLEITNSMQNAVGSVMLQTSTPEQALKDVQADQGRRWERRNARWNRVSVERLKKWENQ